MTNLFNVLVKLDNELAMPKRANPTDAGADLFSCLLYTSPSPRD